MGLDLPSELFRLFAARFRTAKSALLLPDESGSHLAPWVYGGIDPTTQHRLRLSRELLEAQQGFEEGQTIDIAADDLAKLKPFFSSREFALLRRLRITPFFAGERLVGAFLIMLSEGDRQVADLAGLESAAPAVAAKIDGARAILGNGGSTARDAAVRERLAQIFAEAETAQVHVIVARVNLDTIAAELLGNTSSADIYRFKRDLAGALSTMASGSGELLSVGEHAALIIVQSKNPYSERLLSHQFAEGVRALISGAPGLSNLTERTWRYPDGGNSIDEVIDSILE